MSTSHNTNPEEAVLAESNIENTEYNTEETVQSENPVTAVAGQFGLNGVHFAAQSVNFLIVLAILWAFVYKPVVKLLDERSEKIEKSIKQANEIEERVSAIENEKEEIITEAKKESAKILEKAYNDAKQRGNEIIVAAKSEVEKIIQKGKEQLASDKDDMLKDLRKDIADIAVKAAGRIIANGIDEKKSKSLAEEVVRKMT